MPSIKFRLDALPELVKTCGLPAGLERAVRSDMAMVCGPGPVGVVGVDGGRDGSAAAIKLDAEAVPSAWAMQFLAARNVTAGRLAQLREMLLRVGSRHLGYLGLKYTGQGFAGWKMYVPLQPRLVRAAAVPQLEVNQWTQPP